MEKSSPGWKGREMMLVALIKFKITLNTNHDTDRIGTMTAFITTYK